MPRAAGRPLAYRRHAARWRDPALLLERAHRDARLLPQVQRVFEQNLQVCGSDKVWRQLRREGAAVARCTLEWPMLVRGLRGARRGRTERTTVPDAKAAYPLDRVNRQFEADRPNHLWVADFTYVSTWQSFVYVAFVIDVFSRHIVGWWVRSSMQTDFVLDTLEQALYARRHEREGELVHHSDRGSQFGSIRQASGCRRPASNPPSAAQATATTTRWRKRLTGCLDPRSSTGADLRRCARRSTRPCGSGSCGPTPIACPSPSAISRRPKRERTSNGSRPGRRYRATRPHRSKVEPRVHGPNGRASGGPCRGLIQGESQPRVSHLDDEASPV